LSDARLRAVTSGFLPGEDWADEFEAMTLGGELYFRTLVEYLTYLPGRFATPVTAFGPPGPSWTRDRALLCRALGLAAAPQPGDPVRFADEIGPADGVVYFANPHAIGVRTPDALYRFMRGFGKPACSTGWTCWSSRWCWAAASACSASRTGRCPSR
jgi:hypothetical protein